MQQLRMVMAASMSCSASDICGREHRELGTEFSGREHAVAMGTEAVRFLVRWMAGRIHSRQLEVIEFLREDAPQDPLG